MLVTYQFSYEMCEDLMSKLTPREREVVNLLRTGRPQREIANVLVVSRRTVEAHCKNIRIKTNSRNTVEAVAKLVADAR
jgi:DNA-binding CsgD family transcriptional regulator